MSQKLSDLEINIARNSQFTDVETNVFCMRTRLEPQGERFSADEIRGRLQPISDQLEGSLQVRAEDQNKRALVMVSQYDHCLIDLIYRRRTGELPIDIPVVVSNHAKLASIPTSASIDFVHIPTEDKDKAEAILRELIVGYNIDFVVLARYMQILSPAFCHDFGSRIINIHHSFLPGFKGANPYARAWERGVKLIGATAHYITEHLDEGPIIAQATEPVSHRDSAQSMMVKGRDIERKVLASAVLAHCEDRIFVPGGRTGRRTVVFE